MSERNEENVTVQQKMVRFHNHSIVLNQEDTIQAIDELKDIEDIKQVKVAASFLSNFLIDMIKGKNISISESIGILTNIEIFGLTTLVEYYNSSGLSISQLTAFLKFYFGSIIEAVTFYEGDVLFLTATSCVVLWKTKPSEHIKDVMHAVIECSNLILKYLGGYDTGHNHKVELKIIISCGNISCKIFGDGPTKLTMFGGDALNEMKDAINYALIGTLVLTSNATENLYHNRYEIAQLPEGDFIKIVRIHYNSSESTVRDHYAREYLKCQQLLDIHSAYGEYINLKNQDELTGTNYSFQRFVAKLPNREVVNTAPTKFTLQDLLPYVIGPAREILSNMEPIEFLAQQQQMILQIFRLKFIVKPDIEDIYVENILKIVLRTATEYKGAITSTQLHREIMDIYTIFGFSKDVTDLEPTNALKSGYILKKMFINMQQVSWASVSVLTGCFFAGAIGHPHRKQFLNIGRIVNATIRLCNVFKNKVTCDRKTYQICHLPSYCFKILPKIAIFQNTFEEILEYVDEAKPGMSFQMEDVDLIGRDNIYNLAVSILNGTEDVFNYKGICMHGPRSIGKTTIINKIMNVCRVSDSYMVAAIDLISTFKTPYFCASRIYESFFNSGYRNISYPNINIPRELWNMQDMNFKEDIAIQKYRILNYFRDLITCCATERTPVVFIDNMQNIDSLSWEILEIVLEDGNLRLISTATYSEPSFDLKFKISINENIKQQEILPLNLTQSENLVCAILDIGGINNKLMQYIYETSMGRPGYIKILILKLLQSKTIEVNGIPRDKISPDTICPITKYDNCFVIPVAMKVKDSELSESYRMKDIERELYNSFDTFTQLVIKVAAVLGRFFTRSLLIVALKFPEESQLTKAICQLFDLRIFECGSRYMYPNSLFCKRIKCKCYFPEGFLEKQIEHRKEAYCRYIHFKNQVMKEYAYERTTVIRRIELHNLCMDILENSTYICPNCQRNPIFSKIYLVKYDVTANWLRGFGDYNIYDVQINNSDERIKEIIRDYMKQGKSCNQKEKKVSFDYPPIYDAINCKCLDMFIRTCRELVYHSKFGENFPKRLFFLTTAALLHLNMHDMVKAKPLLKEVCELSTNNAKLPECLVSERFRKYILGKAQIGLFNLKFSLQKLESAKNHLAIAFRQYDFPSVAFHFKTFRPFLKRPFQLKQKVFIKKCYEYKNYLIDCDLGNALLHASKIFYITGDISLAKTLIKYSISIFFSLNANIPILTDHYCNAIDFYQNFSEIHTCIRFQKQAIREIQNVFANGYFMPLLSLCLLIQNLFNFQAMTGNIRKSLRLGYRWVNFTFKLYAHAIDPLTMYMLGLLLIYNYRLYEIANLYQKYFSLLPGMKNQATYYLFGLVIYIRTGFSLIPIELILDFCEQYYQRRGTYNRYFDILLSLYIRIHLMRSEEMVMNENFVLPCTLNQTNCRRPLVVQIVLLNIEIKLHLLLKLTKARHPTTNSCAKELYSLFGLAKTGCERVCPLYKPWFYILKAWFSQIMGQRNKYETWFKIGFQCAKQQENYYYECLILQTRINWNIGERINYRRTPLWYAKDARLYSVNDCMSVLYTFPNN